MNPATSKEFVSTQDKSTKKHNTADTSREAYAEVVKSGQIQRECQLVLAAIRQHQPITSRKLSVVLGIERTNITRSLYDLLRSTPMLIKEAFEAKCPITKKTVKHYALIEWKSECKNNQEVKNDSN